MSQNNKSSNPNNHKRKSIRLKGYDYSRAGLYFVSICTQNRECLFGKINDGEMVAMPNHFHCIIEIFNHDDDDDVGATLVVARNTNTPNVVAQNNNVSNEQPQKRAATNRHNRATTRVAPTLGNIIGAFKFGAGINAGDITDVPKGRTALMWAAMQGNLDFYPLLN